MHFKSYTILDTLLQLMWIGWVLVLYTNHFTLHAFSALVSFGSYDLNEAQPWRANSQFIRTTDMSGDWRVISYCLFVGAVLIECWKSWVHTPRSSQAVHMDGGHEWRSLCCCCCDWMLRILSFSRNNLVSFDWMRTGAKHMAWTFLDSYLPYLTSTQCFKEAVDTKKHSTASLTIPLGD